MGDHDAFIRAMKAEIDAAYDSEMHKLSAYIFRPIDLPDLPPPTRLQRFRWWVNGWRGRFSDCWLILRHGYEARHPLDD